VSPNIFTTNNHYLHKQHSTIGPSNGTTLSAVNEEHNIYVQCNLYSVF